MAALKIQATGRAVERIFRKAELVEGEVLEIGAGRWMVASASRPYTYHIIRQRADGRLVCSCEAAIYDRTCWHLAWLPTLQQSQVYHGSCALRRERTTARAGALLDDQPARKEIKK